MTILQADDKGAFEGFWEKVKIWASEFADRLPQVIMAILSLLLFYALSRLIVRIIERVLPKISKNEAVNRLISSISSAVIVIVGIFAALSILNLDKTVTSLLAGVGIVGLALGFAFQNAAANILSGVIMAVQSPINVGDIIESYGQFGEVKHIGLRATRMTNPWGQEVEIPNRLVLQEPFEHFTYNGVRRVDVDCRVPLNEDLERVHDVVVEAVKEKVTSLNPNKQVELFFMEFEEFSVKFELRCWVNYTGVMTDYFKGQSEAIIAIQKGLSESGIEIPIPPRAIHFPDGSPEA